MKAEAEDYKTRVRSHLQTCRPKMCERMRTSGSLTAQVTSLAQAIAGWINTQAPKPGSLDSLSPEQKAKAEYTNRMIAESDAMRAYLPRDEETERLIGPSGGYEDPVDNFDSDE